ncbi:MAG: universal stress protein [Planctomycetota bacterium]
MELKTVLALTDCQETSVAGLKSAFAIAAKHGADLVVGHVLVPRTLDPADVREFLTANGLDPDTAKIDIEVDADIVSGVELLEQQSAPDLIVLSSKRHRGFMRLLYAGLPAGLVGETTAPVLALHAGKEQSEFRRALVCVDGSDQSQGIIDCAAGMLADGGEVIALFVIEDSPIVIAGVDIGRHSDDVLARAATEAEKFLARLHVARTDLSMKTEQRTGDAVDVIRAARADHNADLVVVGAHGVGGRSRFVLGGVAEAVVREIDVPVLTVPTKDAS